MSLRSIALALTISSALWAQQTPQSGVNANGEGNPSGRQPVANSTTPTDHPLPSGAASARDPRLAATPTGWSVTTIIMVVFIGACVAGFIYAMRQQRAGGQSQTGRS
jgi:hypothetical protein